MRWLVALKALALPWMIVEGVLALFPSSKTCHLITQKVSKTYRRHCKTYLQIRFEPSKSMGQLCIISFKKLLETVQFEFDSWTFQNWNSTWRLHFSSTIHETQQQIFRDHVAPGKSRENTFPTKLQDAADLQLAYHKICFIPQVYIRSEGGG